MPRAAARPVSPVTPTAAGPPSSAPTLRWCRIPSQSCRQCHVPETTPGVFRATAWSTNAPPRIRGAALLGSPPPADSPRPPDARELSRLPRWAGRRPGDPLDASGARASLLVHALGAEPVARRAAGRHGLPASSPPCSRSPSTLGVPDARLDSTPSAASTSPSVRRLRAATRGQLEAFPAGAARARGLGMRTGPAFPCSPVPRASRSTWCTTCHRCRWRRCMAAPRESGALGGHPPARSGGGHGLHHVPRGPRADALRTLQGVRWPSTIVTRLRAVPCCQASDWAAGAHGKRVGGWAPPRVVAGCPAGHDPHRPAWETRLARCRRRRESAEGEGPWRDSRACPSSERCWCRRCRGTGMRVAGARWVRERRLAGVDPIPGWSESLRMSEETPGPSSIPEPTCICPASASFLDGRWTAALPSGGTAAGLLAGLGMVQTAWNGGIGRGAREAALDWQTYSRATSGRSATRRRRHRGAPRSGSTSSRLASASP